MGTTGATPTSKSEKASSPAKLVQDQPASHPYPEWSPMQVYYGHSVAMSPYAGAAVPSGHAPHPYMWGPQPMLLPFMPPYSVIYPHGVHPQAPMPLVSQTHVQGVAPSSSKDEAVVMAFPLSVGAPAKAESIKDANATKIKKLKKTGAASLENGKVKNHAKMSGQSSGDGTEPSSDDASPGNHKSKDAKACGNNTSASDKDTKDENAFGVITTPSHNTDHAVGAPPSPSGTPGFELWTQDDKTMKREKRKQSNRESARRSRLRKQAETEELSSHVQTLSAENTTLTTEIGQLIERSEKLRQENLALTVKLDRAKAGTLLLREISSDKLAGE